MHGRDISRVHCSCGGIALEAEATDTEEQAHGCGRRGCCVTAPECGKCKTRFTIALASPEID